MWILEYYLLFAGETSKLNPVADDHVSFETEATEKYSKEQKAADGGVHKPELSVSGHSNSGENMQPSTGDLDEPESKQFSTCGPGASENKNNSSSDIVEPQSQLSANHEIDGPSCQELSTTESPLPANTSTSITEENKPSAQNSITTETAAALETLWNDMADCTDNRDFSLPNLQSTPQQILRYSESSS